VKGVDIFILAAIFCYEAENRTRLNVFCQLVMNQEYAVARIVFFNRGTAFLIIMYRKSQNVETFIIFNASFEHI